MSTPVRPGRRSDGEGNIRKRGETWQARIRLGGLPYSVSAASRRAAVHELHLLTARFHSGTINQNSVTVRQWLGEWLERERSTWKATTFERNSDICRVHLLPKLGAVPLAALTPADISDTLRDCSVRSEGTRLRVYRTLHRALAVAVFAGLLPVNPCAAVEAPRAPRYRPSLWAPDQIRRFIATLEPTNYGTLWAILLGSGCRLGEVLAFRWSDYEPRTGTFTVSATLSETRTAQAPTAPKTPAAYREVMLPTFARAIVDAHREETGSSREARIVLNSKGRSPTRWLSQHAFVNACKSAEVPTIRIHDLRHLHASVLLAEGLPLTEVSERLGHSSPAVTANVYAHALKGSGAAAVRALDAHFADTEPNRT